LGTLGAGQTSERLPTETAQIGIGLRRRLLCQRQL